MNAVDLRQTARRRATNISLPTDLVAAAKELGINVSKACSAGLTAAVTKERERRWLEENRAAIESSNAWVEERGLPFDKYRLF